MLFEDIIPLNNVYQLTITSPYVFRVTDGLLRKSPVKRQVHKEKRNAKCNCNSGKKYKNCCLNKQHQNG